jgi:hypothetical protein
MKDRYRNRRLRHRWVWRWETKLYLSADGNSACAEPMRVGRWVLR